MKHNMRAPNTLRQTESRILGALLLLVWLAGCETTPPRDPALEPVATTVADEDPFAWQQLPASDFARAFTAAEEALLANDWMNASSALADIPEQDMLITDQIYRDYLLARIHYQRGDKHATDTALAAATSLPGHPALTGKIINFQRHRAQLAGDYLTSAQLADKMLAHTVNPEGVQALKRLTWHNLQQLNGQQLPAASTAASDPQWQAWLELARICLDDNIITRETELRQWQANHPDHPAAPSLPGGMDLLLAPGPNPTQVALILPLSGALAPAGKAVRDGYLAAHYEALAGGDRSPELKVYDSLEFESATAVFDAAVEEGADFIVGPLTRESVEELGRLPLRPVPVLALNRTEQAISQGGSAMVQFSLAAEDEVASLASIAYGQGARRVLIVRPAGVWGDSIYRSFEQRWQQLGGSIAASAIYEGEEDYAPTLTNALHLSGSRQRAQAIKSLLGDQIEFTPRRRQDVDAIFLLAKNPAEARALKPRLSFYYAGALPVYALPNVHRGIPEEGDRELNGTHLMELPWLLGSNPALRVAIASGSTGSDAYPRLNALGADAHRIQAVFRQLQAGPDALIRGDTGLLTMDPGLRIIRETRLATFDGGVLQPQ
jgi:uncharacterized protein